MDRTVTILVTPRDFNISVTPRDFEIEVTPRDFLLKGRPSTVHTSDDTNRSTPGSSDWETWGQEDLILSDITGTFGDYD